MELETYESPELVRLGPANELVQYKWFGARYEIYMGWYNEP